MSLWHTYESRVAVHGGTKRNAAYLREVRLINNKLPDNLSYTTVDVFPREYGYNITEDEMSEHMFSQNVGIINSDNYNEKLMISMPEEEIELGALIYWKNQYWLVMEKNYNDTVYTKTKLVQCNFLLRWIGEDKKIMEQWSIVEDGTKLAYVA